MVRGEEGISDEGRNWVVYILDSRVLRIKLASRFWQCGFQHDVVYVVWRRNASFGRGNYYTRYGFRSSGHVEYLFISCTFNVVRWIPPLAMS
jgi:hypothetical protein